MGIFKSKKIEKLTDDLDSKNDEKSAETKHRFIDKVKEYSFDKWKNANPTKSLIDFFASSKDEKKS